MCEKELKSNFLLVISVFRERDSQSITRTKSPFCLICIDYRMDQFQLQRNLLSEPLTCETVNFHLVVGIEIGHDLFPRNVKYSKFQIRLLLDMRFVSFIDQLQNIALFVNQQEQMMDCCVYCRVSYMLSQFLQH